MSPPLLMVGTLSQRDHAFWLEWNFKGDVAPHTLKDVLGLKWKNGGLFPSHVNNSNPLTFDLYCLSRLLFPGPLYTKWCSSEHPLLSVY